MKNESRFNVVLARLKKLIAPAAIGFFFVTFLSLVFLAYTMVVMLPDCGRGEYICYWLGVEEKKAVVDWLGGTLKAFGFGLVALLGIWVANRRAAAMEETAQAQAKGAEAQAKGAQAQADTVLETEKGRRQERFRDAVNHLGDESESVRLGGAYALFNLALEEEDLRQSIAEILCAHIRGTTRDEEHYRKEYKEKPSTEIQSLMTLLFEGMDLDKRKTLKKFWKGIRPDLSGGYFRGLKLRWAEFQKANLSNAQFQRAYLSCAQFQGAYLNLTQFQQAMLGMAQFQKANFSNAQFQRANLLGAQFQGADFSGAQFQGATFLAAQFQGADFVRTQFQGEVIPGAQFQEANMEGARFQGALSSSRIVLEVVDFKEKIKGRANKESDLTEVVFSGGLTQERVMILSVS